MGDPPRLPTHAPRRTWRGALLVHGPLLLTLAALSLAYATTLAPSITWANDGADSGDLVTAAAVGGVAHPTGYPTFLLLARAFQLIPAGDPALRTNLLALVAALAAAAITGRAAAELSRAAGACAHIGGALAALAIGLAPIFWSQAVIAEVHSLNALFAACLALFAVHETEPQATRGPRALRGVVAGLALGNHVTIGLLVAAWLATVAVGAPAGRRLRSVAARLPWVGAGLMVYLYLPLRAAAQPPVNWGGPDTLAGLWWTVSGAPYHGLAFGLTADEAPRRALAWAALLLAQFGPAGVALGFGGLLYGGGARRWLLYGSAAIAAYYSLFALGYAADASYAYLLPAYVLFAIWMGCGCAELLAALARSRLPALGPLATVGIAALLLARAPATAARVDARHDDRALAFAQAALAAAPAGAIIVTAEDRDSFSLWYAHYALGRRPDLAVAVAPLLDYPWYRANLRAIYPWLRIPDTPPADWAAALGEANPASPICTTTLAQPEGVICQRPPRE